MSSPAQPSGPFHPTWMKVALAVAVMGVCFLLPQELPLVWRHLTFSPNSITQLEITCAANVSGEVSVSYDVHGAGNRPHDMIRWAVSATPRPYTYRFPLPDAPITELRVNPPMNGTLTIRSLRVMAGERELRRFTHDMFRNLRDVEVIPTEDGWKLVAAPGAATPATRIELFSHLVPEGMNRRNLQRCFRSTGYLTVMLTILLMAVLFAAQGPTVTRTRLRSAAFMLFLATGFATVGNRGLIRETLEFSRYAAPGLPADVKLEIDLAGGDSTVAQLFWDSGKGFNENESLRLPLAPHPGSQTLRFPLPGGPIQALRLDPRDRPGRTKILGLRIVDQGQNTRAVLPMDSLVSTKDIAALQVQAGAILIETTAEGRDPIVLFNAATVERINRAMAGSPRN